MSNSLQKKREKLARKPRRKTMISRQQDEKSERLSHMKNRQVAGKIIETEKEWDKLSLEDRKADLLTCPIVKNLIEGAATRWGRRYKDRRLTREDFVSEFYEEAWDVIMEYSWNDPYYLYEHIRKAIQSRGKDMLRAIGRDVRRAFHDSLSLMEGFEDFYSDNADRLEDLVMLKMFEEELTGQERSVLSVVHSGGSQRDASHELGRNRRTIARTLTRIQAKFTPYRSESVS